MKTGIENPREKEKTMRDRIKKIKFVVTDVDGVMTDGKVFSLEGKLYRFFNIKDGPAFKLLSLSGIKSVIISGKKSEETRKRFKDLGVDYYFEGIDDKKSVLENFMAENGAGWDEICYIGDDLPDVPVMEKAGMSIAPADAAGEAKKAACHISEKPGGEGVFRETVELILKERKEWKDTLKKFFAC